MSDATPNRPQTDIAGAPTANGANAAAANAAAANAAGANAAADGAGSADAVPWTGPLREALADEFGASPRIVALASVDSAGRPRVRSVVCRRIDMDGSVWIASDARSEKNRHLRQNPAVELVAWLPRRREQFRLSGNAALGGADARLALWTQMSDAARALFFWPAPGAPFDAAAGPAFARAAAAHEPAPETFQVLIVRPEEVERLDLSTHPHGRVRWRQGNAGAPAWSESRINP